MSIAFAKGHGTQNDFVLIDDPDGALDLSAAAVRELCDRRAGLGADGVIRVVRTAALARRAQAAGPSAGLMPVSRTPAGEPLEQAAEWFMDYRNADGSPAEMCGNGVRVFAVHLIRRGWIDLPDGARTTIATRAGVKTVRRAGEQISVDLGPWRVEGGSDAVAAGGDLKVSLPGLPPLPGLSVNIGNPHVVVMLPDVETLHGVDLSVAPVVEPEPAAGINVELVVPVHDHRAGGELGHLIMRVHERGVGETRSCGTGTVAASVAARAWGGSGAPDLWRVDVPGGTVTVRLAGTPTAGDLGELTGPAVIVADGHLLTL